MFVFLIDSRLFNDGESDEGGMDTRRSLPLLRRHRHHHRRRRRLLRGLNFIQRSSLLTGKKGEHVFRTRFSIHSSLSAFSSYVFMGYARMGRRLFHGATRSLDYADSYSRRRLVTAVRSLNFSLRFARVFRLFNDGESYDDEMDTRRSLIHHRRRRCLLRVVLRFNRVFFSG